jgi:hypothetical protein
MAPAKPAVSEERFELFGPGCCDKRLPANEVLEEYTFGQFIRLRYKDDGGESRTVTGRLPPDGARDWLTMLGAEPLGRAVSMAAVLSRKPEALPAGNSGNNVTKVVIKDVDELIAERSVSLGTHRAQLDLDAGRVTRLLAGMPTEVVARTGSRESRILLIPPTTQPRAPLPAVHQHTVRDIASFLADPVVPGVGGAGYKLALDGRAVKRLRQEGVVTLGTGSKQVTLTIDGRNSPQVLSTAYAMKRNDSSRGEVAWHQAAEDAETSVAAAPPYRTAMAAPQGVAAAAPQSADAFTLGLYLPWKQSWRLEGYSRGALVHSLTLAPQEDTTIELFTWDRRKRSLEQASTFESDQSVEQTDTSKDAFDVVREMANSNEFKIEGHAKVDVKYPAVEAEFGVRGDYTSKLNETAKRSTNHLQESTQKAAARVRVSRQTKISEASEMGREERVTRKVRNVNMCRTLTLDYFEVLSRYTVTTAFDQENAQICVFVPFPIWLRTYSFSEDDLRINERALRIVLIDSQLADGFQAARTVFARRWAMQHVCDVPACPHHSVGGGGSSQATDGPARKALEDAVNRVISSSRVLVNASVQSFATTARDAHQPSAAEALAVQRWGFWHLLRRSYGTVSETLNNLARAGTPVRDLWGNTLGFIADIPIDQKISMLEQLVDTTPPATLQTIDIGQPNDDVKQMLGPEMQPFIGNNVYAAMAVASMLDRLRCSDPDDAGLVAALQNFQKELKTYNTAVGDTNLDAVKVREERQAQLDADSDQVRSAFPLGDMAVAAERVDALVTHLNAHKSYYRYALLQGLPIGDQMEQLVLLGVPSELVEPRILGMVNGGISGTDLLAVPINTALDPKWKRFRDLFIDKNQELVKLTSSRVVRMPTPGVSIEARLGECDACEHFVMATREIEIDQRRAQVRALQATARQAELEADRFEARIKKGTLDDPTPDPTALHVTLDKPAQ